MFSFVRLTMEKMGNIIFFLDIAVSEQDPNSTKVQVPKEQASQSATTEKVRTGFKLPN